MPFDFGDNISHEEATLQEPQFRRYKMSDLRAIKPPRWLLRDLLFERQIGVVYGPPGSFKSFVVLALASMLVHGMTWEGRPLRPRRVLYVAGEGFPMLGARRAAWFKLHGLASADDGLEVIDRAVDLTDIHSVMAFADEMKATGDGIDLVIFDTLSTCIAGQNECDHAVMSQAVESAKAIGRSLNAAVLFIHHPGKNIERGARGHSSLLGNIDTEWRIERKDGEMGCTLTVTKQKDAEDRQEFYFAARRIPLGELDEDGREVTSLALVRAEKVERGDKDDDVTQQIADRSSIAQIITPGVPMKMSELLSKLREVLLLRSTQMRERIEKALPAGTWMRARRAGDGVVVELRRNYGGNGIATTFEARKVDLPATE